MKLNMFIKLCQGTHRAKETNVKQILSGKLQAKATRTTVPYIGLKKTSILEVR